MIVLMMVLIIASCQENKQANIVFEHVEGMMDEHPDSAFAILDSMRKESESYPRSQKMRYELLCAKAQNKAYVDFTTDSVMKEVVEYYDAHGTANEKVEAHYLLGCTYRDMHEAPMALNCYLDAVECADTLSDDCDYGMLMRVYGQMADLFDYQIMPDEELNVLEDYRRCAQKCNDTYNVAKGLLLMIRPYALKNDSLNIDRIFAKAQIICEENGYTKLIARYNPYLIYDCLETGQSETAYELMRKYESYSDWFDNNGVAKDGHEHYYYLKGLYNQKIGRLDSADYYYRKLLNYGYEYEGCKGLFTLYTEKGITDSVKYYSELMTAATDSLLFDIHTEAMLHVSSLYNYSRNEKIAMHNKIIAHKNKMIAIIIFVSAIIVIVSFVENLRRYKLKKRHEISCLSNEYINTKQCYENAIREQELLSKDIALLQASKQKEIDSLNKKMEAITIQYSQLNNEDREEALQNNDVVNHFKQMLLPQNVTSYKANKREWKKLISMIKNCAPEFFYELTKDDVLTELELMAAVLTFLKFRPGDIIILLNITSQHLNNLKGSVNKKLFSTDGARTLSKNLSDLFAKVYFSR